jgi:lipoprotein-releasing system permease protein
VGGIAISVAAMIIILSAINGLEGLVETLSSKIDADIRITPVKGKTFDGKTFPFEKVRQTEGVEHLSPVVEELCIVKYNERFVHALLKGVEDEYLLVSDVGQHMEDGSVKVREGDFYFCSMDVEVAAALELYVNPRPGEFENVTLFAPVRAKKFKVNSTPFNKQTIFLSGVFNVNSDDELKPVVVARELAASMLEYGDEVSAIEMSLKTDADPDLVRTDLMKILGDGFEVKTRYMQNEMLYKVSQSEKFFVLAMLTFVLMLTAFNILASLTMLVIDKKKDISVLRSMGANNAFIRTIFFSEGILINLFGALIGLVIGGGVVLLQIFFHLIPLEDSVIEYYPVALKASDFVWIFAIVFAVGAVCSYFPVRYLVRRHLHSSL